MITISELYHLFISHPSIVTDTRELLNGRIFFALKGTNFNGNRFALDALKKGAAYAVIDEDCKCSDKRLIRVENVLETLQQLAHYHRNKIGIPILQITGTNGKTTTKELISTVLSQRYKVLHTEGNFNNHIGVPKTLLRLTPEHDIAVIETGANHIGEIANLSNIVAPDFGLITNVGRAHLEGFGGLEGVIRTKSELYCYLRKHETRFPSYPRIFLHANSKELSEAAHGLTAIRYGSQNDHCDIEGETTTCNPFVSFRWREKGKEWHKVKTHLIGDYNLPNLLAAVSVGLIFNVSTNDINTAIATYNPTNHRSELLHTKHNTLILDAYNANPTSMTAALHNFEHIEHDKKCLILGSMKELGEESKIEHSKIIKIISELQTEKVFLIGEEFRCSTHQQNTIWFENVDILKTYFKEHPIKNALFLIKGSNSHHLSTLPEVL